MSKKYYFLKLNPCRADFAQTLTDEERKIMNSHVAYWRDKMAKGKVVVFGPVLHPQSVYGIGVISVDDEKEIEEFIAKDPATSINTYEYYPLMAVLPECL